MANELLIGIKIGAALSGTFQAAFASARGTSLKLGQVADELRVKHSRLGDVMARAMSHPTRNVGELRRQYERLGQTIDQLRTKQEKLAASMAKGAALKSARADLRGQAMETIGTSVALGAPVVQSVRLAAGFQDQVKDVAITGEFSPAEEARLGATIRESALKWNQTQAEIARGTAVLVAGGIQDAKALEAYAPVMAKAATATRASMDDLGSVVIALRDNLKIGEDGFEGALNMLAYAGKRGQFEIRDMAKWLPDLSPRFQALGVTGKEAVAEIGAALQIARKGAGSNDEAANNFRNFLQKITSTDTLKDFEKAGINLKASMMNLRAQGLTPVQSMLAIITQYMQSKGPDAASQFQKAMALKDDKERETALRRLSEAYKLGELFQDMQAMSFIRPAIANQGEMKDIKQGSMAAADKGLINTDFKKRMEGASEQFKAFKISAMDIGITIGDALLPPLTELLQELKPGIKAFGDWAKQHPGVIKGVIGLAGGLLAGKMALIGIQYGINLVLSPFNALKTALTAVSGKWTMLRAITLSGGSGLSKVAGWASSLGKILGGALLTGLRLAGQAVLWIGRALLMNPIGLIITGIALGAYLIYRYWEPIKAFFAKVWGAVDSIFKRYPILNYIFPVIGAARWIIANWDLVKGFFMSLWSEIKAAFAGGIGGVVKLIFNWSPLGLFYKAFGSAIKWLAFDLPMKFANFGAALIDGLVSGIKSKLSAAKDTIVGFGKDIKGWFSDTLGIKSPSRVFMGFGDNIAQGAAIGIGRSGGLASKAAAGMAADTAAAAASQRIHTALATNTGPASSGAGGMTIHFSPQITIQGNSAATLSGQINNALQFSFSEFERMMKRYEHAKGRTDYARNA